METLLNQADIRAAGQPLTNAPKTLVLLHGRGGTTSDILSIANDLAVSDFALLAPQAPGNSWYPASFLALPARNEPWLSNSLGLLATLLESLTQQGIPAERTYFLGFSQGACLALEFIARHATRYGGVAAFTGGLIGDQLYPDRYTGSLANTPIFIGTGNPDPHVPVERVLASARLLRNMGAIVTEEVYPNRGHTISQHEIDRANTLIFNHP